MVYCPNCGNQLTDNAKFCMECGEKLAKISSNNTKIEDNIIEAQVVSENPDITFYKLMVLDPIKEKISDLNRKVSEFERERNSYSIPFAKANSMQKRCDIKKKIDKIKFLQKLCKTEIDFLKISLNGANNEVVFLQQASLSQNKKINDAIHERVVLQHKRHDKYMNIINNIPNFITKGLPDSYCGHEIYEIDQNRIQSEFSSLMDLKNKISENKSFIKAYMD